MTVAKPHHIAARRLLLDHLDLHPGKVVNADLDPLEAGIVGDTDHAQGGDSYHLGADQIRDRNGRNRYSVDESSRDQRGLSNDASAMDIGYFAVTSRGRTWDLYDFNAWLLRLIADVDPDTRDLREVIYSPDGATVRRWDDLGIRSSGDSSHRTHTHLSEYRDADGHRMVNLARRWLTHIGLIEEAPMDQKTFDARMVAALRNPEVARQLKAVPWQYVGGGIPEGYSTLRVLSETHSTARAVIAALNALAAKDTVDEAKLAAELAPAVAVALVPLLPEGQEVTTGALAEAFRSLLARA